MGGQGILIDGDPGKVFDMDIAIGEGTYGEVFKAIIRETGKDCAIKVTEKTTDEEMIDLEQEIMILRSCEHFGIVGYLGSWFHARHNRIWMCLEYCSLGSVSDVMFVGEARFSETEIKAITASMLLALDYLHEKKVIHRDIKAANVLLTESGVIKLADFGVAAVLTPARPTRRTAIGAPYWMAPEVISEQDYGVKCDVWSLGITCYELAETNPPHSEVHPMRALFMIPYRPSPTLPNPQKWSTDFHDFLAKCVKKSQDERATCAQLMEHPFVKDSVMDIRIGVGRSKILEKVVQRALPIIREFRKEEPDIVSPSSAARDSRVQSIRIKSNARVASSMFDENRPISNVYNPRSEQNQLLSVRIRADAIESVRMGEWTRGSSQEIIMRAQSSKKIGVNDMMALLGQQPLTEEESAGSIRIADKITSNFIRQLDDMI